MKKATSVIVMALVLAAGATELRAASPTPGLYFSTDLGGAILMGRGSQSWVAPLNANDGQGDVFNSQSWNGTTLGTQWELKCGVSPSPQTVVDNRIAGTGTIVFTTDFAGGTFWFSKFGPWGDGVNDWVGIINNTQNIVTVQYVNNVPVAARANINTSGYFTNSTSNCALTFAISNAVGVSDTDAAAFPSDYPALMESDCNPTRLYGSWANVKDIAMQIDCVVPTLITTWSSIKTFHR